jgi:hypothetical protein
MPRSLRTAQRSAIRPSSNRYTVAWSREQRPEVAPRETSGPDAPGPLARRGRFARRLREGCQYFGMTSDWPAETCELGRSLAIWMRATASRMARPGISRRAISDRVCPGWTVTA